MTHPLRPRAAVAAAGATALLASLLVPTVAAADDASAPASDEVSALAVPDELFISEYVEGSSNNKAIEIYNGTGADVDLAGYAVQMSFNGSSTPGLTVPLVGTVAAGDVHVLAHASAAPAVLAQADQTNGAGWFNGDDAVTLLRDGAVVDSLGQVGADPGTEWGTGLVSTADNTLRRLAEVCAGDTVTGDVFDPALEWEGFATDTFGGLGSHTATCGGAGALPFVSELHYDNAGADTGEAVEIEAPAGTDLTGWSVVLYNGNGGAPYNTQVLSGVVPDAGVLVVTYPADGIQNGAPDGLALVDATGAAVEFLSYEGTFTAVGGPADGMVSTDIGVSQTNSTPVGQSLQRVNGVWSGPLTSTFGVRNGGGTDPDPDPDPDPEVCAVDPVRIGAVQGSGNQSPMVGAQVTVRGSVVGDFPAFDGFFLQDGGDGDAATSDGIFVYTPAGADVAVGDSVAVTGTVGENFTVTQLRNVAYEICAADAGLPAPAEVALPLDHERYESMYVTLAQDLAILEYFNYGRFGEIVIGLGDEDARQFQPTAVHEPGSAEALALARHNAANRITLDDGLGGQNPSFLRHPNGEAFSLDNRFRGGDLVSNATGVLDYRFDLWRIQPTEGAGFTAVNERPDVPEVGGTTTVASFNVLNYFTTLTSEDGNARGADTRAEFERQQAKIVAAINAMDTDVVGLIEIENNGDVAVGNLVEALNAEAGAGTWDFVSTGVIGTDAITTAFIYQPAEVRPVGEFALLDSSVDPRFLDDLNRPALAQTFEDNATGGQVTVVNNHLKSKGSACTGVGDPEDPDGQGNCNGVRTDAAAALADWVADDPTGTGAADALVIGDLNSYDKEDPIEVLREAGFTDLLLEHRGEHAYTYVFDGMLGYLDYAMANASLSERVTGAAAWNINADEPSVLDYDMTFKPDEQDALFAPDPYRSSDHDPVIVGLDLTLPDTTVPQLEVVASPSSVWPPNNKWVTVDTVLDASDDSGAQPTVTLVGAVVTDAGRNGKGDIEVVSDSRFRVRASVGAVYTLTYEARDAAGNTTTESVTVRVAKP